MLSVFKLLKLFQNPAIKPKFFYTIKYLYGRFINGPSKKSIICYYKWQRDFADLIELRILSWRDYPGLSMETQSNHKYPYKKEARG